MRKTEAEVGITDIGVQTNLHVYLQLSQTWLIFCEFKKIHFLFQAIINTRFPQNFAFK